MNTLIRYLMALVLPVIALSLPHGADDTTLFDNKNFEEKTQKSVELVSTTPNEKLKENIKI